MNWQTWKKKNKKKLYHHQGFEQQFVESVLEKIEELKPEDVVAQYPFIDADGGQRYIDFLIQNEAQGWLLPIELDGLGKMMGFQDKPSYERFHDFLMRQNHILFLFPCLLRYDNKMMLNEPHKIIAEIKRFLHLQSQQKAHIQYRVHHLNQENIIPNKNIKKTRQAKRFRKSKIQSLDLRMLLFKTLFSCAALFILFILILRLFQ